MTAPGTASGTGRLAGKVALASAGAFLLAADEASFVTGAPLFVDGGFTAC